ncbi:MAG: GAF domain-containing protein [Candidatus Eremiobacteraeota bacterium]|nr:GAF domain-containing protein [Candidatus Eremiobacteraeota bacterium]
MKKSVATLLKEACKFLLGFSNCEGAVVFLRDDVHKPLVARLTRGLDASQLRAYCPRDILEEIARTRKSVLVVDASKDSRFRKDGAPFRSALYVPILDAQDRSIGLLYAMNASRPVAFSMAHLGRVEDFAQGLGEKLVELRWSEADPPATPPPAKLTKLGLSERKLPSLKRLAPLGLAFFLLVGSGFGVWRWRARGVPRTAPPIVSATAMPNQPTGPMRGHLLVEGTLLQRPDFKPIDSGAVSRASMVVSLGQEHMTASGSELKLSWGGAFSVSCRSGQSEPAGQADIRLTVPGYKPVKLTVAVKSGKASLGRVIFAPAPSFKK